MKLTPKHIAGFIVKAYFVATAIVFTLMLLGLLIGMFSDENKGNNE
jgi:hypothetical protein